MIKRVSFLPKQVAKKYQVVTTRFIDPSDMIDFCNTSFKSQVLYQTKNNTPRTDPTLFFEVSDSDFNKNTRNMINLTNYQSYDIIKSFYKAI